MWGKGKNWVGFGGGSYAHFDESPEPTLHLLYLQHYIAALTYWERCVIFEVARLKT